MVTYAFNYAIGGLKPMGYHLGNLIVHLLDSWLLYLVALRIGLGWAAAIVAAAIFAIHPLHVEAVTGVVGRAELLMSAGVLGAVWNHLNGRRALALASFAGGLLAKEQAVVLPALLLLYDACRFRMSISESSWYDWRRWLISMLKIHSGFAAVLLSYMALRAAVLGGLVLPPTAPMENPLISLDGITRLMTAVKVAGMYVALFVWPASLVADYSSSAIAAAHSVMEPTVLWGLIAWVGMFAVAIWSFGRNAGAFFSSVLCILTFLPTSNVFVIIGTIMAERLFYLPSAGLCLLVGFAYDRGIRHVEWRTSNAGPRISLVALHVTLAVVCLALLLRTVLRNQDWQDGERLFRDVIEFAPGNAKAHVLLAGALRGKAKYAEALEAYQTALRLNPEYPQKDAYFNAEYGGMLFKVGRLQEAREAFEQAVTLDPAWGKPRMELGLTYASLGDFPKAEDFLRRTTTILPKSPDAYSMLSLILNEQGRYQEALVAAESALQRDAHHLWGLVNQGIALEGLQRPEEARAVYERAVRLSGNHESQTAIEEAKERLAEMGSRRDSSPRCLPGLIGCK